MGTEVKRPWFYLGAGRAPVANVRPDADSEFREAYDYFIGDPATATEHCNEASCQQEHLWRYVYQPGGPPCDESMKRCPGPHE